MSRLQSSKTDEQELMWKKLSTPAVDPDMDYWRKNFFAGLRRGDELTVIAACRKDGKSVCYDIEATHIK